MKKIISLLLILVMLISFCACEHTSDEEIAIAGGESDKISEITPEQEQTQEVQTPTENTEQKQEAQTPTDNTETKQEPNENIQKQEQTKTEAQKPVEEQPAAALKYPELQELNQQLQKEFGLEGKGYPTDVYLQEYLPLKLGYVTKETNENNVCYYRATKDFITKEPITEQMIEAAREYPYDEYEIYRHNCHKLGNYIPGEYDGYQIYNRKDFDSMLSYIEKLTENDFIVKGHFEPSYGTAYSYYEAKNSSSGSNIYPNEYTLHNFVIEKIYTDNCEYKVGDTIEVATRGTVSQSVNGFYNAASATGGLDYRYVNFKNASLEERTFILSVRPKAKEGKYSDIHRLSNIRQNVYEDIPDIDNDRHNLSREILAKYN